MKVMFLDESGDHSLVKVDQQFPIFCLAGCIFDEDEYNGNCNRKIDEFKMRYFNNVDIVLHSREIRKCSPPFNILLNKNTKQSFYADLNNLILNLPFTVLASVILKNKLKNQYVDPVNPYTLSLYFIMERFLYFLEENNEIGYICAESRDPRSNTNLLGIFTEIINNGSGFINGRDVEALRFQRKIHKMIFLTKQHNENGHQIADLTAYPVARFALNKNKLNSAFDIVKTKFRCSPAGKIKGYGLKIFPN